MSFHIASKGPSVLSAKFANGEELNTEDIEDEAELTMSSFILGVDGRDMVGWELVALRRWDEGLESARRNAGADGSVSGAGSDNERRKERAVMGVSKRVTTVGTWLLSNSSTAAWRSAPFLPSTSSWAIFAQRFMSFGPTSRTLRFSVVPLTLTCEGRNA